MRLATYRANIEAESRLGVIVDDSIVDVALLGSKAGVSLPSQMLEFIDLGPDAIAGLRDLLDGAAPRWPVGTARPLANVTLLAPIPRPRKNLFGKIGRASCRASVCQYVYISVGAVAHKKKKKNIKTK